MDMDDSWFLEWYHNEATAVERKIHEHFYDLDEYFEDMRFEPGTDTYFLVQCQSKREESGVWEEDEAPRPDGLKYFSYNYFKVKVEDLTDCGGYYNASEQLLCVPPDADDITILHEMIHMHESIINELPLFFHEMLFWALYQRLRDKIVDLDSAINQHAHLLNEASLYSRGGLHDVLFLLKSFDLDIKLSRPFGTIFGYGRTSDFKYLKCREEG